MCWGFVVEKKIILVVVLIMFFKNWVVEVEIYMGDFFGFGFCIDVFGLGLKDFKKIVSDGMFYFDFGFDIFYEDDWICWVLIIY